MRAEREAHDDTMARALRRMLELECEAASKHAAATEGLEAEHEHAAAAQHAERERTRDAHEAALRAQQEAHDEAMVRALLEAHPDAVKEKDTVRAAPACMCGDLRVCGVWRRVRVLGGVARGG